MTRLLLVAVLLAACSEPDTAPTSTAPTEPPPRAAPEAPAEEPEPPTTPTPGESVSGREAAVELYRGLIRAYNRRDSEAYFASFADTLECFYGRSNVGRAEVRRRRWGGGATGILAAVQLSVVSETDDEIVLLDRGFFSQHPASGRQVLHEKVIVLRRTDAWRVVAETNRAGASCLEGTAWFDEVPAEAFELCRRAHRSCMLACPCNEETDACHECRGQCHDGSLACLGLGPRYAIPAEPQRGARIEGPDDVRRFVETAITMQHNEETGGSPFEGIAPTEQRWFDAVSARLGAPLWRVSGGANRPTRCSHFLLPRTLTEGFDPPLAVERVRCTDERERCVVWLRGTLDREALMTLELHLLFDEERLRVAHLEEPRAHAPPDEAALDRYAETPPPEWAGACPATLMALVEDRVGEDFWELHGWRSEMDDAGNEIEGDSMTRRCGDAARTAVHEIGDRWDCDETSCGPWSMCGNYCEAVGFDESGNVLSVAGGIDVSQLRPEQMSSLRQRVPCGETRLIPEDEEL